MESDKEVKAQKARASVEIEALTSRLTAEQQQRQSQALTDAQQHKKGEAEARLAVHETLRQQAEAELVLDDLRQQADLARRRSEAEVALAEGLAHAEVAERRAAVAQLLAGAHAQRVSAEKLPELAAAVGQRMGEVRVPQIGGDAQSPYTSLLEALVGVVEVVKDRH